MRSIWGIVTFVFVGLLLGGCDPKERDYFREGIGSDLYTADMTTAAELQNIYLDSLCKQALPYVGADVPSCSGQGQLPNTSWPMIVQAGMNDIDRRCDAYLSWLDQKKRDNSALLSEIGAIRVAVDALTNPAIAPGITPIALASVAAAFGLATSTLGNVNALLLQVDHTTVQSVVFVNRRKFREQVLGLPINSKPIAVHALRSYLTICMPMTISASINSTVTVFEQGGAIALERRQPLVSTNTIGVPAPLRAAQTIVQPSRPAPEAVEFPELYKEKSLSKQDERIILNGLCFNKNTPGSLGRKGLALALAGIYQQDANIAIGAPLTSVDRETITKQKDCGEARNFYEKKTFASTVTGQQVTISASAMKPFVRLLNRSKVGDQLSSDATLTDARAKIAAVRTDPLVAAKITPVPTEFTDQITPDLVQALRALPSQ